MHLQEDAVEMKTQLKRGRRAMEAWDGKAQSGKI